MSFAEAGEESPEATATPRQPPVRRTQAERSEQMRRRLVEATAQVLRKKGYAGLRTEEVSRIAKVSRGAQLHHFPTKESLVLATAEFLLRDSLEKGLARSANAVHCDDPLEALIQDAMAFFFGPDFNVILDLVLAGNRNSELREDIFVWARKNRMDVESAWVDVLVMHGIPRDKAEKVLWLTISIIRGFTVRALWQHDEVLFRSLLDEWKAIVTGHLKSMQEASV